MRWPRLDGSLASNLGQKRTGLKEASVEECLGGGCWGFIPAIKVSLVESSMTSRSRWWRTRSSSGAWRGFFDGVASASLRRLRSDRLLQDDPDLRYDSVAAGSSAHVLRGAQQPRRR